MANRSTPAPKKVEEAATKRGWPQHPVEEGDTFTNLLARAAPFHDDDEETPLLVVAVTALPAAATDAISLALAFSPCCGLDTTSEGASESSLEKGDSEKELGENGRV